MSGKNKGREGRWALAVWPVSAQWIHLGTMWLHVGNTTGELWGESCVFRYKTKVKVYMTFGLFSSLHFTNSYLWVMACCHWEVKKPPGANWTELNAQKPGDSRVLEKWLAWDEILALCFTKENPSKGLHGFVWVFRYGRRIPALRSLPAGSRLSVSLSANVK